MVLRRTFNTALALKGPLGSCRKFCCCGGCNGCCGGGCDACAEVGGVEVVCYCWSAGVYGCGVLIC